MDSMKRNDLVISFRCRSYWPCLCAWVAWSWETPPGAQIHRKICGVSRWFGGWFKVPHTCLSDSVFCVFFMGFFGSSHIMTQLLPTIFEKYLVPFGCNEGFMPVGKQSWTWRWIVGSWGDPRNWPFKVKPFAACFCLFCSGWGGQKNMSVSYIYSYYSWITGELTILRNTFWEHLLVQSMKSFLQKSKVCKLN